MRIKDCFIIKEEERERAITIKLPFSKIISLEIYDYCTDCCISKEVPLKRLNENDFLFVWSKDFLGAIGGTYEGKLMLDCVHCDTIYFLKESCTGVIKDSRVYGNLNCSDTDCECPKEIDPCSCCDDTPISIEVEPPSIIKEDIEEEKLNIKNIQCERC